MQARAGLVLGLAVSAAGGVGEAADPDPAWSRVRSPHFEVWTDAGEPLARRAARRLERLRLVLREPFPPRGDGERRIVALVLASRSRFEPLVPRRHRQPRNVAGFFQGGAERDTIVARLALERPGPFASLEHEYAHLVLNRSLPAQPVWLAEGLAELLSDAVLEGGLASLGAGRADHEARVRGDEAPLASLFGIHPDSPDYLGAGDAALYARCWALVRWVLARHGLAGLRSFVETVAAGRDALGAFEERVAPLAQAQATLMDVPQHALLRIALEDDGAGGALTLSADVPSRAEIDERLGELLLEGGELVRARAHLERALAQAPDHVPARIGLAELHRRSGEWAQARRELERALASSPDHPAALLQDARLRRGEALAAGDPIGPALEERLVLQLERALARAPDLYQAALLLAELRPRPYARRLAALQPVFEQDPGRTEVARTMAALHVKQRDIVAAARVLRRARDAARDPAYRFLCEHQLELIAAYAAATVEVRGRLVDLECRPDGGLRFSVEAAPGLLRLEAASARSFLVYGGDGEASGESELVCGAQDRPLVVRYARSDGEDRGIQGSVVWLAFSGPAPPGRGRAPSRGAPAEGGGAGTR